MFLIPPNSTSRGIATSKMYYSSRRVRFFHSKGAWSLVRLFLPRLTFSSSAPHFPKTMKMKKCHERDHWGPSQRKPVCFCTFLACLPRIESSNSNWGMNGIPLKMLVLRQHRSPWGRVWYCTGPEFHRPDLGGAISNDSSFVHHKALLCSHSASGGITTLKMWCSSRRTRFFHSQSVWRLLESSPSGAKSPKKVGKIGKNR